MKKITLKIPLIHILSILLFYILIKVSMETEIQGKNEFAELLYGITFFMRHDIITLVFGVVLIFCWQSHHYEQQYLHLKCQRGHRNPFQK